MQTHDSASQQAQTIAQALPFIQSLHQCPIVIKLGGQLLRERAQIEACAHDIAMLKLVGLKPIVVHGGEVLKQGGVHEDGVLHHDERALSRVLGDIQQDIVNLINLHGARAVGVNGLDNCSIQTVAHDVPTKQIDHIDPSLFCLLQDNNFIPVISPLGMNAQHGAVPLNAAQLACELAVVLRVPHLILLSHTDGVLDHEGHPVSGLFTAQEMEQRSRQGDIAPEQCLTVSAAITALDRGVTAVHFIDGCIPNALFLKLFTHEGIGTTLRANAGPHFLTDSSRYFAQSQYGIQPDFSVRRKCVVRF